LDFLPKKFEDISRNREEANRQLRTRIKQIANRRANTAPRSAATIAPVSARAAQATSVDSANTTEIKSTNRSDQIKRIDMSIPARRVHVVLRPGELRNFNVLAIGTSTGGPVALQEILSKLPENFPLPIILVQHMPGTFTTAFAQRLNKICKIRVQEAVEGDVLQPGLALLAPGGKQMLLQRRGGQVVIRIHAAAPGQTYKPCVDITFNSIAEVFPGKVLSLILTGMGADGREGIRKLKKDRSVCWAQDEASCVVFGMPGAVVEQNLADHVLPLMEMGPQLAQGM
jgi:two-component system chemotaxis response regulator CheB